MSHSPLTVLHTHTHTHAHTHTHIHTLPLSRLGQTQNIPPADNTEEKLRLHFSEFGEIEEIKPGVMPSGSTWNKVRVPRETNNAVQFNACGCVLTANSSLIVCRSFDCTAKGATVVFASKESAMNAHNSPKAVLGSRFISMAYGPDAQPKPRCSAVLGCLPLCVCVCVCVCVCLSVCLSVCLHCSRQVARVCDSHDALTP